MATGLSRNSDIIENLVEQNASHPGWKRNETGSTTLSGVVDELECETFAKEYEIASETDWDSEAPAQTNLKARVKFELQLNPNAEHLNLNLNPEISLKLRIPIRVYI